MKYSFVHKSSVYIWMIGIVAAFVSFFTVEFYESRRLHDQVEIQFHTKVKSLEQSMRSLSELLYSTHHFLQNGNNPTQEQFQHFLDNRTGIGAGIHSVFWVPLIDLAEVEQFEHESTACE